MTSRRRLNDALLEAFDAARSIGTARVPFIGPIPARRPFAGFIVPVGGDIPGSSYGAAGYAYIDPHRRIAVLPETEGNGIRGNAVSGATVRGDDPNLSAGNHEPYPFIPPRGEM